jgi:chloramphenicol O-acetyltransferase
LHIPMEWMNEWKNARYKQRFYFFDSPIYKVCINLNTTNTYFI